MNEVCDSAYFAERVKRDKCVGGGGQEGGYDIALLYSILFSAGIGDVAYTETGTDARASIYDADGNLLQSNVDPEGWVLNHEKIW